MVVREVRIDVFSVTSPGPDRDVLVFRDKTCTSPVADVNPATVGETVMPFDPGLGISANSGLSARLSGAVEAEVYTDAYSVSSGAVPSAAASPAIPEQQR
jgi:hypothetical protein